MPLIQKRFQKAAYALLALIAVYIFLTFRQYGISNDEPVQHEYGRLLFDFYQSGFVNQAAFHYVNLYLYGGFFDLIAAALEKTGLLWLWDMRHLLSALFGLAGLVAVYKITCVLASQRAGFFAILLLALTASWSGAMFTHTKDIPFATCMALALYYSVVATRYLPKIPLRISIKLGIAIGCALGMRIGGGFAVVYLLLTLAYASVLIRFNGQSMIAFWRDVICALLPAAIVAFVLMAIFWPWGVMSPSHPFEAIKAFSHFSFNMLTIDDGETFSIGNVPRSYLLNYLSVKLPEVFLVGLLSLCILAAMHLKDAASFFKKTQSLGLVVVLIATLFPMTFVVLTQPSLYNGVRHFTFVLPPLAVLAALGFEYTLSALEQSAKWTVVYLVTATLFCVLTVAKLVELHPYEYIYYNYFAGNTASAESDWEGDYWSSSLREASTILNNLALPSREKPYLVAVCAEFMQGSAYLDKRFTVTKDWVAADFYMSVTNMHCDHVLQGKVIGKVARLNTILAVVKDRRGLLGAARLPKDAN